MIISHRKKFAFFCNQRTGSKAVGIVLRMSGIFDENDILIAQPFPATRTARIELPAYNMNGYKSNDVNHMTPKEAMDAGFITLEQLREYDCYAFLRNPEDRFLAVRASMQITRDGMFARPGTRVAGVAKPQHEFFFVEDEMVVTPLDFDNYEEEVKMLVTKLGGFSHMDIPAITNVRRAYMPIKVKYDPKVHIREEVLYRDMKNANKNRKA